MKLAIHGVTGRMGQSVVRVISEQPEITLVGAVCAAGDAALGRDAGEVAGVGPLGVEISEDVSAALLGAQVVIDFSVASQVAPLAKLAARASVALVSGTTGLDAAAEHALSQAASQVPVLWAPNMSLGVQVLAELLELALRRLGPDFDVELVELHHRKKLDAPSGTAVRLAEAVKQVRPEAREVRGRDGLVGARQSDEIGVFGVRGGDVVGDHTAYLLGPSERIELTHRATDRALFARGAVRAAWFTVGRAPGRYTIRDVLGG
ncbi:MAG: 4-hydroxy-tetrahydrodipicolinate reductase [Polyangiaceae bacterium]|nr:4-hydroxy-tetrahydrodipicolinate reductase [Polyangiaceae bacterium]MCW5789262.1 4-hydroxy-tetrahydrodipicolinate reductase [Polyangiaceae bacterium]